MPSIEVSHRKQIELGYCLPACVEMVLALYGMNRTQQDIAHVIGTNTILGTRAPNILRLQSKGMAVSRQVGDKALLIDSIARGIPPIIEVDTGSLPYWDEACPHAILITAIEGDNAIVHDPAFDEPMTMRFDDLMLAWIEKDNYTILIERR